MSQPRQSRIKAGGNVLGIELQGLRKSVFRFRADGTNERGLAVMEIADDAAKVISAVPTVPSTTCACVPA